MVKKGDTLIEVTLAVGIFSMVAIAVVAVMSNGTSNAQTALETTLARAEIDAQAEALRFIQQSAASGDEGFQKLWSKILETAYNSSLDDDNAGSFIFNYSPTSCTDFYDNNNTIKQYAFFINTTALAEGEEALIKYGDNNSNFSATSTYPRIIDGAKAEGIYIVGVKGSSSIISSGGNGVHDSSYYDFYIHTCWNTSNTDHPSTISTVIRLLGN